MRKTLRAMLVAVLTFLSAVALGVASAMTAAITLAATALIVPGTGTHDIATVMGYKENARDRFIAPANPSCTASNGCVLVGIPYPASFWPIPLPGWCPGLSCDTWNVSVGTGVANLNSELINQLNNPTPDNQQIVLFGYSQGGAVVSTEMYNLAGLDQPTKDRISVVAIGNILGPQGLWTRLSFLPDRPDPQHHVRADPAYQHRDKEHQLQLRVRPRRRRSAVLAEPAGAAERTGRVRVRPRQLPGSQQQRPHRQPGVRVHRRDTGGGHFQPRQHPDVSGRHLHIDPRPGVSADHATVHRHR